MRGKDLLYDLSFIDDDIVQEAASDEMPECFKKGDKAGKDTIGSNGTNVGMRSKQRSRRRLIAMAACLMLAVGVTAGLSQTDMWSWINTGKSADVGEYDEMPNDTAGAPDKGNGDDELLMGASDDSSDVEASEDSISEDANESSALSANRENSAGSNNSQKEDSGKKYSYSGSSSSSNENASSENSYDAAILPGSGASGNNYGSTGDVQDTPVMSPGPGASDDESSGADTSDSTAGGGAPDAGDTNDSSAAGGGGSSNSNDSAASGSSVIVSNELADYLSGLKYTDTFSNAGVEYTVSSGSGAVYYVNLTEGFARTADGETKLTAAQIEHIKAVM